MGTTNQEGEPTPMGMTEDVGDAQAEADRWNSKGEISKSKPACVVCCRSGGAGEGRRRGVPRVSSRFRASLVTTRPVHDEPRPTPKCSVQRVSEALYTRSQKSTELAHLHTHTRDVVRCTRCTR